MGKTSILKANILAFLLNWFIEVTSRKKSGIKIKVPRQLNIFKWAIT